MSTPPAQLPHSTIAPSQNYQSSLYQLPNQVPQMAQAAPSTQTPADPLEQRVLDLLYPYRDECFMEEDRTTVAQERMALILSENIAFLIRHNQTSYGKQIDANDVSIASRNWQGMKQDNGTAGIGVFVNGNGFTHTVIRIQVCKGESVVERLTAQTDQLMATFFPTG